MHCRSTTPGPSRRYVWGLLAILAVSLAVRFYRVDAPVVDGFWDKQVAVANRARNIAGPPFDIFNGDFDFVLRPDGSNISSTEEIPLYGALVAVGYRLFGEQDWWGRLVSAGGSLIAIFAFVALLRREFDEEFALVAGLFLAASPLLLFYGRSVLPDTCMLGFMILAVYFFRLGLDKHGTTWIIASGIAGLVAVAFKYYGLMVLLPLAFEAWRARRWGGLGPLALSTAIMTVPLAVWMFAVFLRTANPAEHATYFIFQDPAILGDKHLWTRLADRFLWKSCGPVATIFIGIGAYAVVARRVKMGSLPTWCVMGLLFYFLLAPKAIGHEYYELMMLPGAAGMAALGWRFLFSPRPEAGRRPLQRLAGAAVLVLAVVIHSPWVSTSRFRQDQGFLRAADSIRQHCSPEGRIVAGPNTPQPIIHHARRQGWTWQEFPDDWRTRFSEYQRAGGELIVLHFNHRTTPHQRARYTPMIRELPVLDHQQGNWNIDGSEAEFYLLRLSDVPPVIEP